MDYFVIKHWTLSKVLESIVLSIETPEDWSRHIHYSVLLYSFVLNLVFDITRWNYRVISVGYVVVIQLLMIAPFFFLTVMLMDAFIRLRRLVNFQD